MASRLLLAAQVLVGAIDPIGTGRGEDVKTYAVFQRLSFMGHMARDTNYLPGADRDFLPADPELYRTIERVGKLLVMMAVLGNDAAFFKENARRHDFLADHELALQKRV